MGPAGSTPVDDDDFSDLAAAARSQIKMELDPGERLLWTGRPIRGPVGASWRVWMIWLVAVWTIFATGFFLAEAGAAGVVPMGGEVEQVGKILSGFGTVAVLVYFVVVGLSISERWNEWRSRSRTHFALSNRRAFRWGPVELSPGIRVTTIPSRSIGSVYRVELRDGSGDIVFTGNVHHSEFRGFLGVSEVNRVEALVREVLVNPDYREPQDSIGAELG